jgi:hypothetical protein
MEPTKSQPNPLRPPSNLSTRFLLFVCLVDSVLLAWLFTDMWLHGSTPESIKWARDLGAVWGGTAAFLIGPMWKAMKQWPAPYKKVILVGVLISVAVAGGYIWIRAGHTAKLETLFKEDRELELTAAPKKQRFRQLMREKENANSLPEYLQRCAELETAINDYETVERQVDNLVSQMQQEIEKLKPMASYASLLQKLTVLRAIFGKDLEAAKVYRKEIEYAKQLPGIPAADRIRFYNANIQPVIEQEHKIAQDGLEIVKDAKVRGVALPESMYQEFGIK